MKRATWRQLIVCITVTILCTVLAIWAVIEAPVEPAPGVSGLYVAAAVFVPLALWFGIWGVVAGYLSCILMALYVGYTVEFAVVWSLADLFEGLIPLLAFRAQKIEPHYNFKKPGITYALTGLLIVTFVVSALATVWTLTEVFIATFFAGLLIIIAQATVEDKKTWIMWIIFGVFAASIASGIFGVGALAAFGEIPLDIFPTVLFGWVLGDIIVLTTIGTTLMVLFTPVIQRSRVYVKGYFS
ncbi:MAG: hypothetical protein NWF02_05350 [Candidatus Bathyarchaeota archaeon]|nr:hypothetical protein [Candidatus Bathyarchaeum sp.]